MTINKKLTKTNLQISSTKSNKYIVIHYTANNGDTALGNCKYFETELRNASAHYFVDENEIWQCVEDKDVAWHCGASKYYNNARNENSLGIEMCSKKDSNGVYYIPQKTIENTRQLTLELMKKYNIPLENVVRHYDVTGKNCPEPFVRNVEQWNNFKWWLKTNLNKEEEYIDAIKTVSNFIDEGINIEYWSKECLDFNNLKSLFIKIAKQIKKEVK